MCGIIGVTGASDSISLLTEALLRLEYRGYDSAGIAVVDRAEKRIIRHRSAARGRAIVDLRRPEVAWPGAIGAGVGHTRWATHGAPTHDNAHPHVDCGGDVAVVHNGIIENHRELAAELTERGHVFASQTDTEVAAHLVEDALARSAPLDAVKEAVARLRGDFAIAVVFARDPDVVVVARRTSPLIVGTADGLGVVGSDISALLPLTRDLFALDDDEVAEVRPGRVTVYDASGAVIVPRALHVAWDVAAAQKDGFPDFMSKEIHEQPSALRETLLGRFGDDRAPDFEELDIDATTLAAFRRVVFLACGSSYHAALSASLAMEHFARVPSSAEVASEFRYRDPVLDEATLVVAVSQSGESVDTLHALREARRRGATTIAVTNVVDSLMAREAHGRLYTRAGPEIGVASTKCHLAQIALLEAFALHVAWGKKATDPEALRDAATQLLAAPERVEQALAAEASYRAVGERYAAVQNFYFLGRQSGYPIALEGALKLKELAYVRAEAYPAGEMKHGPIALIEPGAVVVAVATRTPLWEKVMANVEEMRARGATIVALAEEGDAETAALADATLVVPPMAEFCSAIVGVVPLQCFAYAIARRRGNDPDRPRNLAKVVTVE